MVHRLGRLVIGETSVAVVVTAPHRRAGLRSRARRHQPSEETASPSGRRNISPTAKSGWKESGTMPCPKALAQLVAGASPSCALLAAQEPPVIRVDVNLVRVLATVKDADGSWSGASTKHDFEIHDNGVQQEIAVFERQTEQPLSVALLIDTSGSTAKDLKYETRIGQPLPQGAVRRGQSQGHRGALQLQLARCERLNDFTRNQATLEQLAADLKAEAGTSLYDAIYLAARRTRGREGRKVMVIVTDGGDTTSTKNFHAALEAAQLADAVIYPIWSCRSPTMPGRNIGGENALTFIGAGHRRPRLLPSLGPQLDAAFADIIQRSAHAVPARLLPQGRAAHQGPVPQARGQGAAAGFAGARAQRLLWRIRGDRSGTRSRHRISGDRGQVRRQIRNARARADVRRDRSISSSLIENGDHRFA